MASLEKTVEGLIQPAVNCESQVRVVVDEREILPLLDCERRDLLRRRCGGRSRRRRLFVVSRTRTTNGKRPVLERQPFHADELGSVVGDEPEPETARVSGNEEIVR